jgi:TctA family transporter
VFVTKPISAVLLGIALVLLLITLAPTVRKTREVAFQE